jgi:hypothetical protein
VPNGPKQPAMDHGTDDQSAVLRLLGDAAT